MWEYQVFKAVCKILVNFKIHYVLRINYLIKVIKKKRNYVLKINKKQSSFDQKKCFLASEK